MADPMNRAVVSLEPVAQRKASARRLPAGMPDEGGGIARSGDKKALPSRLLRENGGC